MRWPRVGVRVWILEWTFVSRTLFKSFVMDGQDHAAQYGSPNGQLHPRCLEPGMVGLKMEVELLLLLHIFGTKLGRATGSEALAPKRGENNPDLGNMSLNLIGVAIIFFVNRTLWHKNCRLRCGQFDSPCRRSDNKLRKEGPSQSKVKPGLLSWQRRWGENSANSLRSKSK